MASHRNYLNKSTFALACFSLLFLMTRLPAQENRERQGTKWDQMDLGPFFSGGLQGPAPVLKNISSKLSTNVSCSFDTEMLRMGSVWAGGFLELPTGRGGLEGIAKPAGEIVYKTPRGPGWVLNEDYGSKEWSLADPERQAHDPVEIQSVKLLKDEKTVFLEIHDIKPVMQMLVKFNLIAKDGTPIKTEIHHTINTLPSGQVSSR